MSAYDHALEELARSSERLREEPLASETVFKGKLLDVRAKQPLLSPVL